MFRAVPLSASLFDYALPPELIAQAPAARREDSRLLVIHRASRNLEHRRFTDLPAYLNRGDILFRNDAAVLPARLFGERPTGGKVECFLLRPCFAPQGGASQARAPDLEWHCLLKP